MGRCEKLLARARQNPAGLTFGELLALAECHGFEHVRTKGSHHLFKRPGRVPLLNFQSWRGKAAPYQVRQLLQVIDELGQEGESR